MYLERIPLVVHAPGIVVASDSEERVTLADLAPTTAAPDRLRRGPSDRDGTPLPDRDVEVGEHARRSCDVRDRRRRLERARHTSPTDWPNLKRLMGEGANFRNAIVGSFPAVTACAHATIGTGTFPSQHGITGHNIRDAEGSAQGVRRRRGRPTRATSSSPRSPTCGATRPTTERGSARSATRCGTWACWATAAGTVPPRRRPGRRLLGRGRVPAAGSRTTPTSTGCRRRCRVSTCSRDTTTRSWRPTGTRSSRPSRAAVSRPAAARRSCATRATCSRRPSTPNRSARATKPSLLYTTFKSPGLHRPRLRDVLGVDRPAARGRRRRDRPDGRAARRRASPASTC